MTSGSIVVKGVIHGKTIELEQESGMPDGQLVSVVLRPALAPGEGLRRSFGSWSKDGAELEKFVAEVYQSREDDRPGPAA